MITVTRNGDPVSSEIHFMTMSPWDREPKITTHDIDGADFDIVYHRGMHSATCTLTGYFKRTPENMAVLDSLKDGAVLVVTHPKEGSVRCVCTSGPPVSAGGGFFVSFSMTLEEKITTG